MFIEIPKWDLFQHYKDRNVPWIKTYTSLLHKDEYLTLTGHQRGVLHGIWLMYAASSRRISAETRRLTRALNVRVTTADLEALNRAGFIELVSRPHKVFPGDEVGTTRAGSQEAETENTSRVESVGTTESSSFDSVKGRSKRSAPPNGLPPDKEHQLQRLLKAAGQDADEGTAHVFASFVGELPEVSVARAVESLASANGVRNRARYLAGALKSESERLGKDEDDDSIPF